MFNSVQLVSPQLFVSVDIRFIKSDGSTSEVLSGNDIELFSRKDTTAMVIREHGTFHDIFVVAIRPNTDQISC